MVRWQSTSASFDTQMATLIGDSLLASAFLTYGGIFDHRIRRSFMMEWSDNLEAIGIPFRQDLDMLTYLATPQEQMKWRGYGLPSDELATQNAILLERFYRYPLVIDPSGQAAAFLIRKYASQKIVQSSFLDSNFLKILASCIRFGTPLLVTDIENLDPILNPVLNKEYTKTGGRTLIRLGTEDIDFSPKFLVILITRNPVAKFAPDLCSRVTVVNFTVTPASLESQLLGIILKSERPDVEHRRTQVMQQQAEQRLQLRELEESLLQSISAVRGTILDDDVVIKNLEKIQGEAVVINQEVAKTELVMMEVKSVSSFYELLSRSMSEVYFVMERLSSIHYLYQFSLQFFLEIVDRVLVEQGFGRDENSGTGTASNKLVKERVDSLSVAFFKQVSHRVLHGLQHHDKLLFMVRLAMIKTHGSSNQELTDSELDVLVKGSDGLFLGMDIHDSSQASNLTSKLSKYKHVFGGSDGELVLSDYSAKQLYGLSMLPAFAELQASMAGSAENAFRKREWEAVLQEEEAEHQVPTVWMPANISPERQALLGVLVIRALRPERTLAALGRYVSTVFSDWKTSAEPVTASGDGDWKAYLDPSLAKIVSHDSRCSRPIMICSERGQDASGKVDKLASDLQKPLLQVAMGSAEGFIEADKCISQALKQGCWVLLRNVHLCIDWLNTLEKRVHAFSTTAHPEFRLFLTCEIMDKLPTALLRASELVIAESTTGIRANLVRFYNTIPAARVDRAPVERARLYGLLAWLNAIIQERLRYVPLGWTKRYEFSETDAICALDVIDEWVDQVASSGASGSGQKLKSHIDPRELPWAALCTLLSQSLYGGRVDDSFDQSVLDSFVKSIFNASSYSPNAVLVSDSAGNALVSLPDGLSRQAFDDWVAALSDNNSPMWLGLPAKAEIERTKVIGQQVLTHLNHLLSVSVDSEEGASATGKSSTSATSKSTVSATAAVALEMATRYLKALPVQNDIINVDEKYASDSKLTPIQR
jgi:dynein heavy chain 1